MSHLKLFAPDDAGIDRDWRYRDGEPVILYFPVAKRAVAPPHFLAMTERTRQVSHNRHCRLCGRVAVEAVELLDQALSRNGRPVPGTASVVGFHCRACDYEWTA